MREMTGSIFSGILHFLSVMTGIRTACSGEDMFLFQYVIDIYLYKNFMHVVFIDRRKIFDFQIF